jgi:hypothetical protein
VNDVTRPGSTLGWPLLGAVLLLIPTLFVIGALTGHTPTWTFLQNPVVLLGSLGVAALGNLWSLVDVKVLQGKPPILRIDIAGNALSIVVLGIAGSLGALLIGYAFVENSRQGRSLTQLTASPARGGHPQRVPAICGKTNIQ